MRTTILLMTLLVYVCSLCTCTPETSAVDPGGSEITNGKVIARNGAPGASLTVTAFDTGSTPEFAPPSPSFSAITDITGCFTFVLLPQHAYNIFIIDTTTHSGAFLPGVGAGVNTGTIYLDTLGTLSGIIRSPQNIAQPSYAFVFVKGSSFYQHTAAGDSSFRFDNIPTGTFTLFATEAPRVGGGCTGGSCGGFNPGTYQFAPIFIAPGSTVYIEETPTFIPTGQ